MAKDTVEALLMLMNLVLAEIQEFLLFSNIKCG